MTEEPGGAFVNSVMYRGSRVYTTSQPKDSLLAGVYFQMEKLNGLFSKPAALVEYHPNATA